VATSTPTSVRLPGTLDARVRARARLERRSYSNCLRVLVERGLDVEPSYDPDEIDPEEVERLAEVASEALREAQRG
jgi:hypothetical protein